MVILLSLLLYPNVLEVAVRFIWLPVVITSMRVSKHNANKALRLLLLCESDRFSVLHFSDSHILLSCTLTVRSQQTNALFCVRLESDILTKLISAPTHFLAHFSDRDLTQMCVCVVSTFANSWCFLQAKYKEASRKEASSCLYHQLPETLETLHAKEATELQSQVHTLSHVAQVFYTRPERVRQCYRSTVIPGEQLGVVCITAIGDLFFWPQRKENSESAECFLSSPAEVQGRREEGAEHQPVLCAARDRRDEAR